MNRKITIPRDYGLSPLPWNATREPIGCVSPGVKRRGKKKAGSKGDLPERRCLVRALHHQGRTLLPLSNS